MTQTLDRKGASLRLRPYQAAAIDQLRQVIESGKRRVVLVLPTGGGKTIVAVAIMLSALSRGKRVLFVAHRRELILQTQRRLAEWGAHDVGVIMSGFPSEPEKPIQVASIDTLRRRERPPADIVFVDEAHRGVAAGYRCLFEDYPEAIHLGLTATPYREDRSGLGDVYEELVVVATPEQLIEDGFIARPIAYRPARLPELKSLHIRGGDYKLEELDALMGALVGDVVREWQRRAEGRRTVVFAVSVAHSKQLCAAFREAGVSAAHLDGETTDVERRVLLDRLDIGELQVVTNCGVLCEGWDQPSVKCLVLARPTRSLGLYLQQAGRVLRPWGKTVPLILDHAGNVLRHGMPDETREFSLQGEEYDRKRADDVLDVNIKTCPYCFAIVRAGVGKCYCGHAFKAGEGREIRTVEGELVMHDGSKAPEVAPGAGMQLFMQLVGIAKKRGFKKGWVGFKYKERYKHWPPQEWWEGIGDWSVRA